MTKDFSEPSDQELLETFRKGDTWAFSAIYERYWYKMYIVAYRKLKDKEIAAEIIQEIFLKFWQNRTTLQIKQLENYLFSAIRYAVIDHIRSQIVKDHYEEYYYQFISSQDSATEEQIALNDLFSTINQSLDQLPEKSREVFKLSRLESWPVSKIALHLQLSEKAVEYHLTKSLKAMRAYLKDYILFFVLLFS